MGAQSLDDYTAGECLAAYWLTRCGKVQRSSPEDLNKIENLRGLRHQINNKRAPRPESQTQVLICLEKWSGREKVLPHLQEQGSEGVQKEAQSFL